MTPGRERGVVALVCAAGAGLVLLAAGRPWAEVRARDAITPVAQSLTGGDLGGAPGALGWAALAGLAALFATRGRVRGAVGALIALFGAGIAYASVAATGRSNVVSAAGDRSALLRLGSDPVVDVGLWWAVSLAGGLLLVAAGAAAAVRGRRWPGMSARYDSGRHDSARSDRAAPPDDAADDDPSAMWRSLDRGEDPTARRSG